MYATRSPPSQKTNKITKKEKEITIHYKGTKNNVMPVCPVSPNKHWLNTTYTERIWTRLQYSVVAFLRAPASMTQKIKYYFINKDSAFSPYTLLSMGQTKENKIKFLLQKACIFRHWEVLKSK